MLLSASPSSLLLLLLLRFSVIGQGIAGLLPIVASAAAAQSQGGLVISCPFSLFLLGRIFLLLVLTLILPFLQHHVRVHPAALPTVVLGQGVVVMVGVCVFGE